MMKKTLVLLFFIGSLQSKIIINVTVASNRIDSVINKSGVDNKKVTQREINLYNITDDNLKKGISVELGRVPEDVFLGDPTPYYNLYEKYDWMEVQRNLHVKSAKIFDVINENVTLKVHSIINNTTVTLKKKISLRKTVESSILSVWCDEGFPDDEIFYTLNVTYGTGVANFGKSFQFQNKWRKNNMHSATMSFGLSNIGYILLEPGKGVIVELRAMKSILLVKLIYSAQLIGSVIANYAHVYGKYHFWAPSVESIMKAAKLKNVILTTEFLEVRGYINPQIKVFDKETLVPVNVIKFPRPFHAKKN